MTAVREYPILFNADMVSAISDGRKTQTRRPVVLPRELVDMGGDLSGAYPDLLLGVTPGLHVPCSLMGGIPEKSVQRLRNPWNWSNHQAPALMGRDIEPDVVHLWVRETWGCPAADRAGTPQGRGPASGDKIVYRTDPADDWQWSRGNWSGWRPSISHAALGVSSDAGSHIGASRTPSRHCRSGCGG